MKDPQEKCCQNKTLKKDLPRKDLLRIEFPPKEREPLEESFSQEGMLERIPPKTGPLGRISPRRTLREGSSPPRRIKLSIKSHPKYDPPTQRPAPKNESPHSKYSIGRTTPGRNPHQGKPMFSYTILAFHQCGFSSGWEDRIPVPGETGRGYAGTETSFLIALVQGWIGNDGRADRLSY